MLVEHGLFEKRDLVAEAVKRIREYEPPEGYYLAFSGGKDSIVLKDLAVRAGVKFDAHFRRCMEPPELVQFIKKHHSDVHFDMPPKSMWQLIEERRMPPTRMVRYCCSDLKEGGGRGRVVLLGVRWEESSSRKNWQIKSVAPRFGQTVVCPILNWASDEIWQYIKERNLPYCSLYDEGFKRLGCVMCPVGSHKAVLREAERWPKIADAYRRAIDRCFKARIRDGIKTDNWKNGNDLYEWWIQDTSKINNPDQMEML